VRAAPRVECRLAGDTPSGVSPCRRHDAVGRHSAARRADRPRKNGRLESARPSSCCLQGDTPRAAFCRPCADRPRKNGRLESARPSSCRLQGDTPRAAFCRPCADRPRENGRLESARPSSCRLQGDTPISSLTFAAASSSASLPRSGAAPRAWSGLPPPLPPASAARSRSRSPALRPCARASSPQ
jgi:hypothetical protein